MNYFSTKFINFISIIISILIFLIINYFINNFYESKVNNNSFYETSHKEDSINIKKEMQEEKNKEEKNQTEENQNVLDNWYLEIKKINLKAPIKETVEMEILNNYIGHFEETDITEGNIGLAAHNRGFKNNYFEKLKELKKGDEIMYKYNNYYCIYVVDKIEIIRNTDWSYLEKTKENKITLITCTENKPEFRLCVQAIMK